MMGNGNGIFDKCVVESEYTSIGEWRMYKGTWKSGGSSETNISVLEKTLSADGPKRDMDTHENATRALKIYRHPFIVKYHDAGTKVNVVYIVTERVQPLAQVLKHLSPLEICVGLHCVMQALVFCHDTCKVRHNNFGMDSIFLTQDGSWKLAGMEFSVGQSGYDEAFLQRTRAFRHEKVIPPEEKEGSFRHLSSHGHAGDVYALGLLVKELLEMILKTGDLLRAKEFLDRIKKQVLVVDPTTRPRVSDLLADKFFQHDFLEIYTFLRNLAVKDNEEKRTFFCSLASRFFSLPESLAASRLSDLLLSRFVLLDATAKRDFLPHLLQPCTELPRPSEFVAGRINPIFTVPFFKEHLVPQLIYIFNVQDLNIRSVLLTHFEHYVQLFDRDVLTKTILPQILLGIQDVNDTLVAASLRALAQVVLVLGGETVIGPTRRQHFSPSGPQARRSYEPISSSPSLTSGPRDHVAPVCLADVVRSVATSKPSAERSSDISPEGATTNPIPASEQLSNDDQTCNVNSKPTLSELERSSPDGSESSEHQLLTRSADPGPDDWSDWEDLPIQQEGKTDAPIDERGRHNDSNIHPIDLRPSATAAVPPPLSRPINPECGLGQEFDIRALTIRPSDSSGGETDFFVDMQPVILASVSSPVIRVDKKGESSPTTITATTSFAVEDTGEEINVGWGEDLDWSNEL